MHDAGAVVAHQVQNQRALHRLFSLAADGDLHVDTQTGQTLKVNAQGFELIVTNINPQNAGELPGHACHAAFQPVAAMPADGLGKAFDQTGLVG